MEQRHGAASDGAGGVEEAQAARAAQCSGAGVVEGAGGNAEVCTLRRQTAAAQESDGCRRARRPWTGDGVGTGRRRGEVVVSGYVSDGAWAMEQMRSGR